METRCMQLRVLEKHALVIFTLGMRMLRVTVYFKNIGLVMIIFSFGEENKQRVVKTIVAKMNHSSYC